MRASSDSTGRKSAKRYGAITYLQRRYDEKSIAISGHWASAPRPKCRRRGGSEPPRHPKSTSTKLSEGPSSIRVPPSSRETSTGPGARGKASLARTYCASCGKGRTKEGGADTKRSERRCAREYGDIIRPDRRV